MHIYTYVCIFELEVSWPTAGDKEFLFPEIKKNKNKNKVNV